MTPLDSILGKMRSWLADADAHGPGVSRALAFPVDDVRVLLEHIDSRTVSGAPQRMDAKLTLGDLRKDHELVSRGDLALLKSVPRSDRFQLECEQEAAGRTCTFPNCACAPPPAS